MKVLGMGNALVDIIIHLSDDKILEELNLPKASMQLIDADRLKTIQDKLKNFDAKLFGIKIYDDKNNETIISIDKKKKTMNSSNEKGKLQQIRKQLGQFMIKS